MGNLEATDALFPTVTFQKDMMDIRNSQASGQEARRAAVAKPKEEETFVAATLEVDEGVRQGLWSCTHRPKM